MRVATVVDGAGVGERDGCAVVVVVAAGVVVVVGIDVVVVVDVAVDGIERDGVVLGTVVVEVGVVVVVVVGTGMAVHCAKSVMFVIWPCVWGKLIGEPPVGDPNHPMNV
jgi:hypothetical protein